MSEDIKNPNQPITDDFLEYQQIDKSGGPSAKKQLEARNYFNPSIYEDNSDSTTYLKKGMSKTEALKVLQDGRFIQDIYDYYRERDGKGFSTPGEAVEYFMNDRMWKNMTTHHMGAEYFYAKGATENQKKRLARLEQTFQALPNFYEDGGTGGMGLLKNVRNAILDPINLLGIGIGVNAATKGAVQAVKANKNILVGAATRGGVIGGAVEGTVGAAAEGTFTHLEQKRNQAIGMQDEYDAGRTALSALFGGVVGGVAGGVLGAGSGALTAKLGMKDLKDAIITDPVTGAKSFKADWRQSNSEYFKGEKDAVVEHHNAIDTAAKNIQEEPAQNVFQITLDNHANRIDLEIDSILDKSGAEITSVLSRLLGKADPNLENPTSFADIFTSENFPTLTKEDLDDLASLHEMKRMLGQARDGIPVAAALKKRAQQLREIAASKAQTPKEGGVIAEMPELTEAANLDTQADIIVESTKRFAKRFLDKEEDQGLLALQLAAEQTIKGKEIDGVKIAKSAGMQTGTDTKPPSTKIDLDAPTPEVGTMPEVNMVASLAGKKKEIAKLKRQRTKFIKSFEGKEMSDGDKTTLETFDADIADGNKAIKTLEQQIKSAEDNANIKANNTEENFVNVANKAPQEKTKQETDITTNDGERSVSPENVQSKPSDPITVEDEINLVEDYFNKGEANHNIIDYNNDQAVIAYIDKFLSTKDTLDIPALKKQLRLAVKGKKGAERFAARKDFVRERINRIKGEIALQRTAKDNLNAPEYDFLSIPLDFFDPKIVRPMITQSGLSKENQTLAFQAYDNLVEEEAMLLFRGLMEDTSTNNLSISQFLGNLKQAGFDDVVSIIERQLGDGTGRDVNLAKEFIDPASVKTTVDGRGTKKGTFRTKQKGLDYFLKGSYAVDLSKLSDNTRKIVEKILDKYIQAQRTQPIGDDMIRAHLFDVTKRLQRGELDVNVSRNSNTDELEMNVDLAPSMGKNPAGRIQSFLRPSRGGVLGQLFEKIKRNGQVFSHEAAARIQLDEARLDRASDTSAIPDPNKYRMLDENGAVTSNKKEAVEIRGENAEIVGTLDEISSVVRKQMRKEAKETGVKGEHIVVDEKLSQELRTKLNNLTGMSTKRTSFDERTGVKQIQFGDPVAVRSQYPNNSSGGDILPDVTTGRKDPLSQTRTPRKFWMFRLAKAEELKKIGLADGRKKIPQGFDQKEGMIPGTLGLVEINGQKYFKQKVEAGIETETRANTKAFIKGQEGFYDEATHRVYFTRDDVPLDKTVFFNRNTGQLEKNINNEYVGETFGDLLADIRLYRRTQTHSTAKQLASDDIVRDKTTPRRRYEDLVNQRKEMSRQIQALENPKDGSIPSGYQKTNIENLKEKRKLLKAEIAKVRKQLPDDGSKENVNTLTVAKLADAKGIGQKGGDINETAEAYSGKPVDKDDIEASNSLASKLSRKAAYKNKLKRDMESAREEFKDGIISEIEYEQRIAYAQKQFKRTNEKGSNATNTKPVGKFPIKVYNYKGIEIDLNNHLQYKTRKVNAGEYADNPTSVTDITFLGEKVGLMKQFKDGRTSAHIYDVADVDFASAKIAQETLPKLLGTRIENAYNDGLLKKSKHTDPDDGLEYIETDASNTTTYQNAKLESDDAPVDDTATDIVEHKNPNVNQIVSDIQVPTGRKVAIQLVSGRFSDNIDSSVRIPSSNQSAKKIADILGTQIDELFIIGHVDSKLKGAKAKRTFRAVDDDNVAAYTQKSTDVDAGNNLDKEIVESKFMPMTIKDAQKVRLSPDDFNGNPDYAKITSLAKLVDEIELKENTPWTAKAFSNIAEYQKFMKEMELLYDVLEQKAPHGIKFPNARRIASMAQLQGIMRKKNVSQGEINAVLNVLHNIAGSDSRLPQFSMAQTGRDDIAVNIYKRQGAYADQYANRIGIDITQDIAGQGSPEFVKTIHEVGHWSYANVLTPQDKKTFWRTMGKYIGDRGVDFEELKKRLPGQFENELRSPQEFFAQQFTQYALANNKAGLAQEVLSLWKKIAKHIQRVVAEKLGIGSSDVRRAVTDATIEPDLIPIFQRVFPDEHPVNRYNELYRKMDALPRGDRFILQKLMEFDQTRIGLIKALDSGDIDQMRAALGGRNVSGDTNFEHPSFMSAVLAFNGEQNQKFYKLRGSKDRKARLRLLDTPENQQDHRGLPTTPTGRQNFAVLLKVKSTMSNIRSLQKEFPDQAGKFIPLDAADLERMAGTRKTFENKWNKALEKMSSDELEDQANKILNDEVGDITLQRTGISENTDEAGNLYRLAPDDAELREKLVVQVMDSLNVLNELDKRLRVKLSKKLPEFEKGRNVSIQLTSNNKANLQVGGKNLKARQHKQRAGKKFHREQTIGAQQFVKIAQDIENDLPNILKQETEAGDAVERVAKSPNEMSLNELLTEMKAIKGTPSSRLKDMARIFRQKMNTVPEIRDFKGDVALDISQPTFRGKPAETVDDLIRSIYEAKNLGNDEGMLNAAVYLREIYGADPKLSIKSSEVNKLIDVETAQTRGVSGENGIPAKAPVYVKELLRKVTHRDPIVEDTSRTLVYRLVNLLGKTRRSSLGDANFLSMDDISRLMPHMKTDATASGAFRHVNDGPELNYIRKTARKLGIALKSGDAGASFIGIRGGAPNADYTAIHEVGHLLINGGFDSNKKGDMLLAFREALQKQEPNAVKQNDIYRKLYKKEHGLDEQTIEARIAEEWFVDGWVQYLGNRIAKQDVYGNITLKGRLHTMLDEVVEYAMYLLNGLIGSKSIRQQYRYLTFGGDLFQNRKQRNQPVKSGLDATNSYAVDENLAPRYAREAIQNYDEGKDIAVRTFLNARETDNLMDYVYYHGTPNGMAFNKHENPDVKLNPSEDGLFGQGVYLTKDAPSANVYSETAHLLSLKAMVRNATDNPRALLEGDEIAEKIVQVRNEMDQIVMDMDARVIRASTMQRAEDIRKGLIDPLDNDPANAFVRDSDRIKELANQEKILYNLLNKTTGATLYPKVLPMFVKADNMFSLKTDDYYSLNSGMKNDVKDIFLKMSALNVFDPTTSRVMINNLQHMGEEFTGEDMWLEMVGALEAGGRSEKEAKDILTGAFKEMGYDGFLVSELHPQRYAQYIDGIVIFDNKKMKHVDADHFDGEVDAMFYSARENNFNSLNGAVINEMVQKGKTLKPSDYVYIGSKAETEFEVPPSYQRVMKRMMDNKPLGPDEITTIQQHTGGNFIRENSVHARRIGANWFGNKIKPENGAGIYQKHSADLAKSVQPIMTMLRKLDDNRTGIKRYLNKTLPFFKVIPGAGRAIPDAIVQQPQSHRRILTAIRRQDISNLNGNEKAVAELLIKTFRQELDDMHDLGISVGDVTKRTGSRYYVPQVWDAEAVANNPGKFTKSLMDFIIRDKRANGEPYDLIQVEELADKIMKRITQTEGRIDVDQDLYTKASSDPFYERIINLQPDDVPEFEQFMVNDLEGIVTKYFDRTTRKKLLAKEFGANAHGLDTYVQTAKGGTAVASRILTTPVMSYSTKTGASEPIEVSHLQIPPLVTSTGKELEDVLERMKRNFAEADTATANNYIDQAKRELMSMVDTTDLSKGQLSNLEHRVDAVVNALKDFPIGVNENTEKFFRNMTLVLDKKPLSDDIMANKISKNLRSFNAVTLLGWTTLTSLPDVTLPLIRSGNFSGWAKSWYKYMNQPEYREFSRNIGVGVENLVHDRMTHMSGDGSQKFQHAFFYGTGLTSWTNMNREISAIVGYESFKSQANIAQRHLSEGTINTKEYKTAKRFLERYGLGEYANRVDKKIGGIAEAQGDDQMRYAIMRFVNETIFTPDPNDIPLWAQTPSGAAIFQLKSFPLMMGRMAKYVGQELVKGNPKPAIALLSVGAGMGFGANASKDFLQSRGGEDQQSRQLRDRQFSKTIIGKSLSLAGWDQEEVEDFLGSDADRYLGQYLEGIIALGGLGLLAEFFFNAAAQADNQHYGANRAASAVLGPTFGAATDAFLSLKGGSELLTEKLTGEDDGSNAEERIFARTLLRRVPVVGGFRPFSEGGADLIGGEIGGSGSSTSIDKFGKNTDLYKMLSKFNKARY